MVRVVGDKLAAEFSRAVNEHRALQVDSHILGFTRRHRDDAPNLDLCGLCRFNKGEKLRVDVRPVFRRDIGYQRDQKRKPGFFERL